MEINKDFIMGYGAGKRAGGGSGGGGTDLAGLEVYVADFFTDPPDVEEGALSVARRTIVC